MNTGHEYSGVRLNTAECVSAQMRGSVSASGFSERGGQLVEAAPTRSVVDVSWPRLEGLGDGSRRRGRGGGQGLPRRRVASAGPHRAVRDREALQGRTGRHDCAERALELVRAQVAGEAAELVDLEGAEAREARDREGGAAGQGGGDARRARVAVVVVIVTGNSSAASRRSPTFATPASGATEGNGR